MATRHLLYVNEYKINDSISVNIPSLGDVIDNEDEYYSLVTAFTSMPVDMMVQLEDAGFDFSKMSDYDLFLLLFNGVREMNTSLILRGVELSTLHPFYDDRLDMIVLKDESGETVIDRNIYTRISVALRYINFIEKNHRKPGNKEAKEYMLERARKKLKRLSKKEASSYLESLIVSVVNTEQFKYDFESVRGLNIYQFNASVRQVMKKVEFDNRMFGVYSGNISVKDMKQEDLVWLAETK